MNGEREDNLVNALMRTFFVLQETGAALQLQNLDSNVAKGLLFEADCARTVIVETIFQQQQDYRLNNVQKAS